LHKAISTLGAVAAPTDLTGIIAQPSLGIGLIRRGLVEDIAVVQDKVV